MINSIKIFYERNDTMKRLVALLMVLVLTLPMCLTVAVADEWDDLTEDDLEALIFLAALQNIPVSAKEAAQMEGATAWEYFWKITLPYVSPMILACLIFTVIDSFTAPDNLVMGRVLDMQSDWQYGWAAAMAWIYFAIVLAAVGLITLIMNKFIYYEVD